MELGIAHQRYGEERALLVKRKHIAAVLRGATPRRLGNLLLCEAERLAGRTHPVALPYIATIDLSSGCSLHCPGCPTGNGTRGRRGALLKPEVLTTFLDEVGHSLLIAHLYNWGEPLLNAKAADCVSLLSRHRIYTSLSTHLSFHDPARLRACFDAGLDHLIVSVDGASPETYERYRRGGDFRLVLRNLRQVVAWKRAQKSIGTRIEWQFIVFDHNKHELKHARWLAHEIGVDHFSSMRPYGTIASRPTGPCTSLWRNVVLQSDGGLSACCKTFLKTDDFGDLKEGLQAFRHGSRSIQAREVHLGIVDRQKVPAQHPCLRCPVTAAQLGHNLSDAPIDCVEGFKVMGLPRLRRREEL